MSYVGSGRSRKLPNVPVERIIDKACMARQQGMVMIWMDNEVGAECGNVVLRVKSVVSQFPVLYIPNEDRVFRSVV